MIGCCAGWVCGGDVTAASLKAAATPDKTVTVTGLPGSATLRISAAQVREGRGQNVDIKHI